MNTKFSFGSPWVALIALCLFAFTSCEEDEPLTTESSGRVEVEMTDAPIDDPELKAVFVTVADVRIDGQSLEGFSATTVEVSALQNGETERLFSGDVAAESYSTMEIVLQDETDAFGNAPGCYALNEDNEKVALEVANNGVLRIQESAFTVEENSTVRAVVDFDLRKALVRTEEESQPYQFAAQNRLQSSLRFVNRAEAGTLSGTVNNQSGEQGDVVVYAYASGTYSDSEAEADENNQFLNAVSSTTVQSNGNYTLAFLEAGTYQLVAVSYKDEDSDGEAEFMGEFESTTVVGIDLGGVSVDANSTTTVNFTLTGLLP